MNTKLLLARIMATVIGGSFIVAVYLTIFSYIVESGPPTFGNTFGLLLLIGVTIALILGMLFLIWKGALKDIL